MPAWNRWNRGQQASSTLQILETALAALAEERRAPPELRPDWMKKRTQSTTNKKVTTKFIQNDEATCKCCGKEGHYKSQCASREKACSHCGKIGHLKAVCRHRDTPQEELKGSKMSKAESTNSVSNSSSRPQQTEDDEPKIDAG